MLRRNFLKLFGAAPAIPIVGEAAKASKVEPPVSQSIPPAAPLPDGSVSVRYISFGTDQSVGLYSATITGDNFGWVKVDGRLQSVPLKEIVGSEAARPDAARWLEQQEPGSTKITGEDLARAENYSVTDNAGAIDLDDYEDYAE